MIPSEMQEYPHWIVWRAEDRNGKLTKVPYQPRSLFPASSTKLSHWATYDEAMNLYQSGYGEFSGVGFVLSPHSPYSIVDLDNPSGDQAAIENAIKVLNAFETYTEVSQSGQGFHLVLRGKVPSGVRRGKIELYSEDRFFAMTGNTYRDLPIISNDEVLTALWRELGGNDGSVISEVTDSKQTIDDKEVFDRASKGHEMFQELWFGRWQQYYGSQSEADLTLVNLLSFYSGNKEQIARMFLWSELGKRPKAKRKGRNGKPGYLAEMIEKSFDNRIPEATLETLMGNLRKQIEEIKAAKKAEPTPMLGNEWAMPPGLLGEIAEFIQAQAPRPVREIALAGAIGLMAGICGQAYNVSATGLNHYILLLATTGRGKEAAKAGISKIMKRVTDQLPSASQFIGPADIASGQALAKYLGQNPCFVSVLGEFGIALNQMCLPTASAPLVQLRRVILDVFNKSGKNDTLQATIYSDKTNNTSIVRSPALTILGETTPDSFFPHLNEHIVAQGLLPRFTCIEYAGKRTPLNEGHGQVVPSDDLIGRVIILAQNALTLQHRGEAINVQTDEDADLMIRKFNLKCDDRINNAESEVARQLWSRAHMKLLKLAALIAVGEHPFQPSISLTAAEWARNVVEKDVANIISRFDEGKVGADSNEQNQLREISNLVRDYVSRPYDATMERYKVDPGMHNDKVIQLSYLSMRAYQRGAFRTDKMGPKFAVARSINQLIDIGAIVELSVQQIGQRYSKTGKAYATLDLGKLL